jgi:hypothetical protein
LTDAGITRVASHSVINQPHAHPGRLRQKR